MTRRRRGSGIGFIRESKYAECNKGGHVARISDILIVILISSRKRADDKLKAKAKDAKLKTLEVCNNSGGLHFTQFVSGKGQSNDPSGERFG